MDIISPKRDTAAEHLPFLTDLPVLQMTSMVLAQPSLLGERSVKIRS